VLLITDGEISAIDSTLDSARQSGHRVFVVGIGSSVAEAHLRRLAQESGGACDFLAPGEAATPAIVRMFTRMRAECLRTAREVAG
jgi:Ca-activated chloride channel family protein